MIGERLKAIRGDNHDTQEMLAEKLNVSKSTVQSWEQEKSSPSHESLVAICKLYNVSSDFLLGLNDADPLYTKRQRAQLSRENQEMLRKFTLFLLAEQKKQSTES